MLLGEQSAILSTFIKLSFVKKIFASSIFEWPLKTGFTVVLKSILLTKSSPFKRNKEQSITLACQKFADDILKLLDVDYT